MKLVLVLVLVLGLFDRPAAATPRSPHPGYLAALGDLRTARWDLQRRGGDSDVKWDESRAIADIDAAIRKIKAAGIDDGKSLDDHQPDDDPAYLHRLRRALDTLIQARWDLDKETDSKFARHLNDRARNDIESAEERTRIALCDNGYAVACGH